MNRSVAITFSCLFIVMLGFSITLAVLPLRLGSDGLNLAGSTEGVAFHVGALTGVYALAQFVAAPFWGRLSDRHSRRLVLTWSLMGFGASQLMFGVAPGLPLLYASRVFGGLFSAAMFPLAAAAVADTFPKRRQLQGMAWLNASASLGVVAGPALSGLTSQWSWRANSPLGQIEVDGFSIPFFALAMLSVAMTAIALWKLPQHRPAASRNTAQSADTWVQVAIRIRGILAVVVASQIAMALFMTAFALYADAQLSLGPQGIGAAFALCGLLTASVQVGTIWAIARRWDERRQVLWGSFAMAAGLLFVPITPSMILMIGSISIFVVGAAIVATSLLSLVAKACPQSVGAATGLEGSATYLGQVLGPLVAGILFAWDWSVPFYAGAAVMLAATALWIIKPLTVDIPQEKGECILTTKTIRVAVNGYGVIGKRVAEAVKLQRDMELVGIADLATDYRLKAATRRDIPIYAASSEGLAAMRAAGIQVLGDLDDLLGVVDVIVDCTPKGIAAKNLSRYQSAGVKSVFQGGEKHALTGHSFVAQANYETAIGRDTTRVVSCNTTSIVRVLGAIQDAGLLASARGVLIRRATDPWESDHTGIMNTIVPEAHIPSHQGPDAQCVRPELDLVTMAAKAAHTQTHNHYWTLRLTRTATREEVLAALRAAPRIAFIRMSEGVVALNNTVELMHDIGRPRGDMWEVAVWEDVLSVQGDEAFLTYQVDNQAIVIPETIDAIRAMGGAVLSPCESMDQTEQSLGMLRDFTHSPRL